MDLDEEQIKQFLKEDPGNPLFADYADLLRAQGRHLEGIECCLAGLSRNPQLHRGRLILARLYFEKSYLPFCVRELQQLQIALPENAFVQRLIQKLAPGVEAQSKSNAHSEETLEQIVAETEFDMSDLDLIDQDEGKDK